MKLFTEVELSDDVENIPTWLDDYLNDLVAMGNTYHDVGMIWGGRLSSSRGIFAANVNADDKSVSRHLIFMTDGKMEPNIDGYNAYGVEEVSNRIAPLGSSTLTVTARHTARFSGCLRSGQGARYNRLGHRFRHDAYERYEDLLKQRARLSVRQH